jgi:hypothetical protein
MTESNRQHRFGALTTLAPGLGFLSPAQAEPSDLGQGLIHGRPTAENPDGKFVFKPAYQLAFAQGQGNARVRWLLLTDQDPTTISWRGHASHTEALGDWCKAQKSGFVLVEINLNGKAELLTQCVGGALSVAMISTINGLDSVQLKLRRQESAHLSGELVGGSGSCGSDDELDYCESTMDYRFDTALMHAPALQ